MLDDKSIAGKFRLGVGMVIINCDNKVFWACRSELPDAWQFPQGGVERAETEQVAMYRELAEETGLQPEHVEIVAQSSQYLSYTFPEEKRAIIGAGGQVQRWFLLRMIAEDECINLAASPQPEFSNWRWVDYWQPVKEIVAFKREVYQSILTEFADFI